MDTELKLNDMADDLLILNKHTVENLFNIEDGGNSLVLYMFYYKTAKWQKTNSIKANDTYVRQCLKWGKTKITNTKKTLKDKGLIDIINKRNEKGELIGWYIQLHYLVPQSSTHNHCQQEVDFTTSCYQDTNALRKQINALRKQIDTLQNEKKSTKLKEEELKLLNEHFNLTWEQYPNKKGKTKALEYFFEWIKGRKISGNTIKLTDQQMYFAVIKYKKYCEENEIELQYIKHGDTFFNKAILDYVEE